MELLPRIYLLLHRRHAREDRVTPQSWAVLQHLTMTGPLTVGEMARHLERAQSVVTEIVDGLERRGLLARMRDERDRRRTLVWLTDAAHEVMEREREVLDRTRVHEALSAMSPSLREGLVAGLEAFAASAEARRTKDSNQRRQKS